MREFKIGDKLNCKHKNLDFDCIVNDKQEDIIDWGYLYVLKITTGPEKGKYSMIHSSEIGETVTRL